MVQPVDHPLPGGQEAAMRKCFVAGKAAFPRVAIDEQAFATAWSNARALELASGEPAAEDAPSAPAAHEGGAASERALAEEFLRLTCLASAPGALATLESEYLLPLGEALSKKTGDEELAAEALQCLRHKLLVGEQPRLAAYKSTGHLKAWLQVVGMRLCQDLARQRGARWAREAPLLENFMAPGAVPETLLAKAELDELFAKTLTEIVRSLPQRERYALRMHVLAGWNVSQIGEALSTHRATAARWVAAAKERLNAGLRAALRERLQLGPRELEHVFALLNTQLDLRLSQIFNATPEAESGEQQ